MFMTNKWTIGKCQNHQRHEYLMFKSPPCQAELFRYRTRSSFIQSSCHSYSFHLSLIQSMKYVGFQRLYFSRFLIGASVNVKKKSFIGERRKIRENNSAGIRQSTPSSYFSYSSLTTFLLLLLLLFLIGKNCAAGDDTYISFSFFFSYLSLYSLKVRHTYVLRHSGWVIYTSGVLYHSLSLIENRYSRGRESK